MTTSAIALRNQYASISDQIPKKDAPSIKTMIRIRTTPTSLISMPGFSYFFFSTFIPSFPYSVDPLSLIALLPVFYSKP